MSATDTALPAPPVSLWRRLPHWLENLAITFAVCVFQTLLIFGLRVDSWMHELGLFMRHYETASDWGRAPVHFVVGIAFVLNMIVVSIARRDRRLDHD